MMLRGRCPGNPSWLTAALHFTRLWALFSGEPCPLASPVLSRELFPSAAPCGLSSFLGSLPLSPPRPGYPRRTGFHFPQVHTVHTDNPASCHPSGPSPASSTSYLYGNRRHGDHPEFASESWSAQAGIPGVACPFTINRLAWGEELPPTEGQTTASRRGHLARWCWMSPWKYDVINRPRQLGQIGTSHWFSMSPIYFQFLNCLPWQEIKEF